MLQLAPTLEVQSVAPGGQYQSDHDSYIWQWGNFPAWPGRTCDKLARVEIARAVLILGSELQLCLQYSACLWPVCCGLLIGLPDQLRGRSDRLTPGLLANRGPPLLPWTSNLYDPEAISLLSHPFGQRTTCGRPDRTRLRRLPFATLGGVLVGAAGCYLYIRNGEVIVLRLASAVGKISLEPDLTASRESTE